MKVFLTVCSLFLSTFLTGQHKYPSYETVVTRFFEQYVVISDNYYKISFQKKPAGWFVSTEEYKNGEYLEKDNEIFWEKKSGNFKSLKFEPAQTSLESGFENTAPLSEVDEFLESGNARLFAICPYYNYDGWETDVIKEFSGREDQLSDTILYALGRAYSSYASRMFSANYGPSQVIHQFKLGPEEKLNKSQLRKYRKYQHGAINAYSKLAKRNPDFQTIVGSIGTKAANEHVNSFINLMMYSSEHEALKELKDNLYSDFYLALARNYLNSCAPDAVLITGGDNDTFPLWYLQAKYGIRKDVTVMVTSFLNLNRFIRLMCKEGSVFNSIELSVDKENYNVDGPNAYLPVMEEVTGPIDLKLYLKLINEHHKALQYSVGDTYYNMVPSSEIAVSTAAFFEKDSLPASLSAYALDPVMNLTISSSGIELKDLVILDLIATNNWDRPIYLNNTSLSYINPELNNHSVQEGLSYRLSPLKKEDAVDHRIMYDNIKNKFDWDLLSVDNNPLEDEKNLVLNYRSIINNLVGSLLEADEMVKAKEILMKNLYWMPLEIFPPDYSNAKQVDYLLQLDERKLAFEMADQLLIEASDNLEDLLDAGKRDIYKAEANFYALQILMTTFEKHEIEKEKFRTAYLKFKSLMLLPEN